LRIDKAAVNVWLLSRLVLLDSDVELRWRFRNPAATGARAAEARDQSALSHPDNVAPVSVRMFGGA
jgi:hypothetical protein